MGHVTVFFNSFSLISFLKKSVLGEYIDSRDAKGIADILNEKLEAIQNKGKRKKSRNKVRILIVVPFVRYLILKNGLC